MSKIMTRRQLMATTAAGAAVTAFPAIITKAKAAAANELVFVGFGGTYQNEEIAAAARLPLSQHVCTNGSVSWRRNEPLAQGSLLRSVWIEGIIGYRLEPWLRLEGFYSASRQTIDQPGTERDHNRVGFQIVTIKPLRVR